MPNHRLPEVKPSRTASNRTLGRVLLSLLPIAAAVSAAGPPLSPESQTRTIEVKVDPRMELLAAVQILSGYDEDTGLITKVDFPYKREVLETFRPFRNHEAVQVFDRIRGNFSYDAPPALMLFLSDPPALTVEHPLTEYLMGRAGGEDNLTQFIGALRRFAADTKFIDFFNRHLDFYRSIEEDVRTKLSKANYVDRLERYYRTRQHSYTIITTPLFHGGGFGPRVSREDGSLDVYYIGGPRRVEGGNLVFQTEESLRDLTLHEFSHSFVNPLTDKHMEELSKYDSLMYPILSFMNRHGYSSWDAVVNEHVVRAATARMDLRDLGKEQADSTAENEKRGGFFYIEAILEKLSQFEADPRKYPTFAAFYPEIVREFKRLHDAKLGDDFYWMPYDGTINTVLFQKPSLIVIVPTHEPDKESEKRLQEANRFPWNKTNIPVITDDEALGRDLSSNFILAVGTMEGNAWLRKYADRFPFKVLPDRVVADKEYPGNGIRLTTTSPNPQNPERAVLIYTAQSTFHVIRCPLGLGTTDYTIADGWKVVKAGYYKKGGKTWTY